MSDRWGNLFAAEDARETSQAAEQLGRWGSLNPNDVGRASELEEQTGIPPTVAAEDPAAMRENDRLQTTDALLKDKPGTRRWINSDPANAALAADETEKLTQWEQFWGDLQYTVGLGGRKDTEQTFGSRVAGSIVTRFATSARGLQANIVSGDVADTMARLRAYDEIDADQNFAPGMTDLEAEMAFPAGGGGGDAVPNVALQQYAMATPEQRAEIRADAEARITENEALMEDLEKVILAWQAEAPEGEELSADNIVQWAAFNLSVEIPVMTMQAALSALTGPAAPGTFALMAGAEQTGQVTAAQVAEGADLTDPAVRSRTTSAAALNTALDMIGVPAQSIFRRSLADVDPQLVERAVRDRTLGRNIRRTAVRGAAGEGFAEAMQEVITDWAVLGEIPEMNAENLTKYFQAFLAGGLVGGVANIAFNAPADIALAREAKKVREAGASTETLQRLQDAAPSVKLRERSPKKWREFLQSVGTEDGNLYVDARALNEAVANGQVDIAALGVEPDHVTRAADAGARVQVKQNEWAAKFAGTEAGQTVLDNAATTETGLTKSEAETFAEVKAELEQKAKAQGEVETRLQAARKEFRGQLRDQLVRSGQAPKQASANADLQTAFFETMARRLGGDEEVFQRFQLAVEGPGDIIRDDAGIRSFNQGAPKVKGQVNASENRHGLNPHLRVRARQLVREGAALFPQSTNANNVEGGQAQIDELLRRHPKAALTPLRWTNMMSDALGTQDVPVPPYQFINDINGGGAERLLSTLSPGQIADVDHGFENAREFRRAYVNGEISVADTGKLFLWSFLSRGVSPYTQESLFIDAFEGIEPFIEAAATGDLDLDAYRAWAKSAAPRGSGQPGAGATHNLNAFGTLFLKKMSEDAGLGDGRSRLQVIHEMMMDPDATGQQVRREFSRLGQGVGIDNKVVSFTLLVAGFDDVLVLDRVQVRQMWNDGRFDGINLYNGYKAPVEAVNAETGETETRRVPITGSALSSLTYGTRGLMIYEAMERAVAARVTEIYTAVGRPEAASVGRYHWETWVASSQQEASHGTIDAILAGARGEQGPLTGVTAKEGEYGSYAYGARYGRGGDSDSAPYFLYEVPDRGTFKFTVQEFQDFLTAIKRPSTRVVPNSKFKVTEAGNAPWFFQEGVDLDRLAEVAGEYGGAVQAQQVRGIDDANGADPAISDRSAADLADAADTEGRGLEPQRSGRDRGLSESRSFDQSARVPITENTIIDGRTGEPVVMYHGTSAQFDEFADGMIFLSSRRGLAVEHAMRGGGGGRLIEAHVALSNPLEVGPVNDDTDTYWLRNSLRLEQEMRDGGHDSIMVWNEDGELLIIATRNDQVTQIEREFAQGADAPRGRITLPAGGIENGETIIQLFEGADPSTFIHESGHFFLEAFRSMANDERAPQQMRDDLAAIHKWMGKEDDAPYTTEQQEMWAESFENYIFTGKAPSRSLKSTFAKMSAWLVTLYRSAANIGARPSKEIAEIMDRMLATDEEIAAQNEIQSASPAFTARPPYISEKDWNTYLKVSERSEAQAQGEVLATTMADLRRRRQKAWADAYSAALEQAEEELRDLPEYRLITALGDNENPDVGEGARMDRAMLVDMFGEKVLEDLSRGRLSTRRNLYQPNGADPEQVADLFGFRNAAQMVQSLRGTPPLREAADIRAKARADEEVGDLEDETTLEEEAEAALKNTQHTERVAREAAMLQRGTRRGGLTTWQQQNEAARQAAEEHVSKMRVREAMGYRQFARASQKAAREAQRQLARVVYLEDGRPQPGQSAMALEAAAEAKREQLLNDHLYRIARETAKDVESARKRFRKVTTAKSRARIGADFMDVIDGLLLQYDFRIIGPKQVQEGADLRAFVKRMIDDGREAELGMDIGTIASTDRRHYTELSVSELEGVIAAIDNVAHLGRTKTQALADVEKKNVLDNVDEIVSTMRAKMRGRKRSLEPGGRERAATLASQINLHVENANTLLMRMDGFENGGPAMSIIKRPLDEAAARLEERRDKVSREIVALFKKHYSRKEMREINKREHRPEIGDAVSKNFILSAILNSGNVHNFERLTNPEATVSFTPDQLQALVDNHATERDWRFAQDVIDYIETFWPEIRQQERDLTGVSPKKVEAQPMLMAPDFFKGGYYPISYDPEKNFGAFLTGDQDAYSDVRKGRSSKATTRHGHVEERLQSTKMSLRLDLGVMDNHIMQVVHDLEMRKPINDAARYLDNRDIGRAFEEAGRVEDLNELRRWLRDTAAGDQISVYGMENIMRFARKALTAKYIGLKMSTVLIQPLGAVNSGVVVGNRALAMGYIKYLRDIPGWAEEARKSVRMRNRIRTMNKEINQFTAEAGRGTAILGSGRERFNNAIMPYLFTAMQQMQYWAVDLPTWVSSYEKNRQTMSDEAARQQADEDVDRAQGSGLLTNRAAFERGTAGNKITRTEMVRSFTMLSSYLHAKYNLFKVISGRMRLNDPVSMLVGVGSLAQMFMLETILVSVLREGWPDDEDERTENGYAWWVLRSAGIDAISTHPVGRPIAGVFEGYGASTDPMTDAIELFGRGGRSFQDILEGEGDLEDYLRTFDAGATPFLLPTGQIKEMARALAAEDPQRQIPRSLVGLPVERE